MRFRIDCPCGHVIESNEYLGARGAFRKHAATCLPARGAGIVGVNFDSEDSASPANVSPAPGQRWEFLLSDGWQQATIRADGGLIWANGCGSIGWNLRDVSDRQVIGTARCLDPNPTPASPALPAASPSRQRGAGAPPAGHVPCEMGCGRWTRDTGTSVGKRCYCCLGSRSQVLLDSDWTPPASAAPVVDTQPTAVTPQPALADVQRIRHHQVAEGGPSATRAAPGRARDTFADLVDEWDLLPGAGR